MECSQKERDTRTHRRRSRVLFTESSELEKPVTALYTWSRRLSSGTNLYASAIQRCILCSLSFSLALFLCCSLVYSTFCSEGLYICATASLCFLSCIIACNFPLTSTFLCPLVSRALCFSFKSLLLFFQMIFSVYFSCYFFRKMMSRFVDKNIITIIIRTKWTRSFWSTG